MLLDNVLLDYTFNHTLLDHVLLDNALLDNVLLDYALNHVLLDHVLLDHVLNHVLLLDYALDRALLDHAHDSWSSNVKTPDKSLGRNTNLHIKCQFLKIYNFINYASK